MESAKIRLSSITGSVSNEFGEEITYIGNPLNTKKIGVGVIEGGKLNGLHFEVTSIKTVSYTDPTVDFSLWANPKIEYPVVLSGSTLLVTENEMLINIYAKKITYIDGTTLRLEDIQLRELDIQYNSFL